MPVSLTPEQAASELRARGHAPEDVMPLSGGLWSAAFAFREKGREYVVRFHERRDDLEKDRFAERWRGGALRIPHMVEISDFQGGGYGIAERVRGTTLDDLDVAGMRAALPAVFASLDALRGADLSGTGGYGLWHGDGRGERPTWRAALANSRTRDEVAHGGIGLAEFDVAAARVRELVAFAPEERWVAHNDLLNYNVRVDDAGVVLLDWGASIFGDFLYDFALLTVWWPWFGRWDAIDVRAEIDRHFTDIGLAIPHYAERMRLCQLDIAMDHIGSQATRGMLKAAHWTAARVLALAQAGVDN